jgi:threonine dehydrogenase-like Zn-dependent dehydrogenase
MDRTVDVHVQTSAATLSAAQLFERRISRDGVDDQARRRRTRQRRGRGGDIKALSAAIDIVRRGGTLPLIGVYGGAADPLSMLTLFDKQIQLRMGRANVKWVDDIMPAPDRR